MREIKIEILDNNDVYLGDLQLENFKDFPLSLTKGIGDINNLTKRQAVYSLDFDVPVTQNNNKLLFGVAYVNTSGDSLDALSKNKCRILVDGNQIEYGFIRIFEHTVNDTYKATFTGGNGDWVEQLSNVYLNQLPWVAESNSGTVTATETFSSSRINAVNLLDSDSVDIFYPYIERNIVSPTDTKYLRPMLYARSVVKRMFEKIGYTVDGSWIDSDDLEPNDSDFRGLLLDPAFKFINDDETVESTRINVTPSTGSYLTAYALGNDGVGGITNVSKYNAYFDDETFDVGNNWTPATSTYTAPRNGTFLINFSVGGYAYFYDANDTGSLSFYGDFDAQGISKKPPSISFLVVRNNVSATSIDGEILFESNTGNAPSNFVVQTGLSNSDELTIWWRINDDASGFTGSQSHLNAPSLDNWQYYHGSDSTIKIQIDNEIDLGQEYQINGQLGENLSCVEILQDLKTMFNLYFSTNYLSKKVTIETRDNYYQNIGQAENITSIVDLSKKINIDSKRKYRKELKFKYAEDSSDGYLAKWQKINNRTYGEYTHDFGDNYEQGVDVIETKLIAPTIQKVISPNGANIVSSVIRREWDETKEPSDINQDYKIRAFYGVVKQQFNEDGTARRTVSPLVVESAMMESFGNVSTESSKQLTFNGSNGLFSRFYAKTIANIEDLRKVELYLKMPLYKFRALDLSKPVYIDWSIPQLQGYYIIEEVSNYKIESFDPVKVRLLRFKNYDAVDVDTTQKTNINENTAGGQTGDNPQPIYYIFDEGTSNESYEIVYDIENGSGNLEPLYYE
jgi:hypothetical protein